MSDAISGSNRKPSAVPPPFPIPLTSTLLTTMDEPGTTMAEPGTILEGDFLLREGSVVIR
jgi:hypothetical protein